MAPYFTIERIIIIIIDTDKVSCIKWAELTDSALWKPTMLYQALHNQYGIWMMEN